MDSILLKKVEKVRELDPYPICESVRDLIRSPIHLPSPSYSLAKAALVSSMVYALTDILEIPFFCPHRLPFRFVLPRS